MAPKYKNDNLQKVNSYKSISFASFKMTYPYTILPPSFNSLLDLPSRKEVQGSKKLSENSHITVFQLLCPLNASAVLI